MLPVWLLLLLSCNSAQFKKAEDAQDAAREFIRASLDGDYDKANFYLYQDSAHTNEFLLNKWKSNYSSLSAEERQNYKAASIIVLDAHNLNDSVSLFKYINSYKKDTSTVKIVRYNGEWQVDLKELIK